MNLSGFTTPEQDWGGLSRITGNLKQAASAEKQAAEQQRKQQVAGMAALGGLVNEKDLLTGTPQDPVITQKVNELRAKGIELVKQGLDAAELQTILLPEVGRLSVASQNLKALRRQKEEAMKILKENPAADLQAFDKAFNSQYFETDAEGRQKLRDLSEIDPSEDWAAKASQMGNVFTRQGIDKWVANSATQKDRAKASFRDKSGGVKMSELSVEAPSFFQLNTDPTTGEIIEKEKFVPKYELATDQGDPLFAEFEKEDGSVEKSQVRLLDKNVFESLMGYRPAFDYIMQEVKNWAKETGEDVTGAKAGTYARALAYTLLKNTPNKKAGISVIGDTRQPIVVNTSGGDGSRSSGDGTQSAVVVDEYTPIEKEFERNPNARFTGNQIPNTIFDAAAARVKKNKGLDVTDNETIQIGKGDKPGTLNIYSKSGTLLAVLTKSEYGITSNKPLGQKAVQKSQSGAAGSTNKPSGSAAGAKSGRDWSKSKRS